MPNKAEKNDAIRPLSNDEETFGFDRLLFAPSGIRSPRRQNLPEKITKILRHWGYIYKWKNDI